MSKHVDPTAEGRVTSKLPDAVEPGTFGFDYITDAWGTGDLQEQRIRFNWTGGRTATWTEDVSPHEEISPASSSPFLGWASWRNGRDLLLAFVGPDEEVEGWARVPNAAPTADLDDDDADDEATLADPRRWLRLAQTIAAVVNEQDLPGLATERYGD